MSCLLADALCQRGLKLVKKSMTRIKAGDIRFEFDQLLP